MQHILVDYRSFMMDLVEQIGKAVERASDSRFAKCDGEHRAM